MGGEEREDKSNSRQQGGRGRIRELAEEARKEGREAAKASLSAFEKALAVFLFQFNGTLHNILFHRIFQQTPLLPPKGKPPPSPGGNCPGGNMEKCIDACVPLSTQASVTVYAFSILMFSILMSNIFIFIINIFSILMFSIFIASYCILIIQYRIASYS